MTRLPYMYLHSILMIWVIGLAITPSKANDSQSSASPDAPSRLPNVIFILADDLGWSDTTLYGNTKLYQTPNLERLAARGMTFTRAYSASPLCSPTRSAILTGLSPARTGFTTPSGHVQQVVLQSSLPAAGRADQKAIEPITVTRLSTDYPTLVKSLKAAGYATGHFGKWHLGLPPYSPIEHGFDIDLPKHSGPGPAGSYVAPWRFKDFQPVPNVPEQHIEDRMASEAATWMRAHKNEPFYMNYWMFSVHAPFDAKKSLIQKYSPLVDKKSDQRCPTYAAMVESMDDAVGTLLDTLDELKIADNTIIVFTSDNGGNMYSDVDGEVPTSNAPLRGGKATMFEGGTRVPCVIAWPEKIAAKSICELPVQSEDYYPTIMELIGRPLAEAQLCDGRSIAASLLGHSQAPGPLYQYFPHSPAVPDWLPASVSIHDGQWKLIRIFHDGDGGDHRHLLFDLKQDVSESVDLTSQFPDRVRELDDKISAFLNRTSAVVPRPNPKFDPARYDIRKIGVANRQKESRPQRARATPAVANDEFPGLMGWKARQCDYSINEGIVRFESSAQRPFLGVGIGKHPGDGQSVFRFRMRSSGENGEIEILASPASKSSQSFPYHLTPGEWAEVVVPLRGLSNDAGILRLYFPGAPNQTELDWAELTLDGQIRRWEF